MILIILIIHLIIYLFLAILNASLICSKLLILLVMYTNINNIVGATVQLKLIQDMLESYDRRAKPTWNNDRAVNVTFSMDL